MKQENYSQAIEDYLTTIYDLSNRYGHAGTNQIARAMKIKPASVTGMMQKMAVADPPLVVYRKHHGATLTPEGEKAALEILRHHRLLESFLAEVLGFTWDEVHAEAHRLEHVISEKFEERMAAVLGEPSFDPHGDPIPSRELVMPEYTVLCINELQSGQQAIIKRVRLRDAAILRFLSDHGIVLHVSVRVEKIFPFDDNLHIYVDKRSEPVVLNTTVTNEIFVEPETSSDDAQVISPSPGIAEN